MAAPALTDLVFYTNRDLTATDWSTNFTALINYLTAGTYDVSFNSLTLAGAVTFATGTNLTTTGTITAGSFVGNGAALTGLDINNKNWLYNGQMMVDSISSDQTLAVLSTYYTRVDGWAGAVAGDAVAAGSITKISDSTIGTTGYALKFSGVTLTGSGVVYLRQRMYKEDASKLIGKTISVQALVKHDVGVNVNYVFTIRKADAADDFTTTTQIGTSGNIAKATGAGGQIKYEGLAMGACGNGVEFELKASPGAITTKNFEFTEIQLEISPTITDYEQLGFALDSLRANVIDENVKLITTSTRYQAYSPYGFHLIEVSSGYSYTINNQGSNTPVYGAVVGNTDVAHLSCDVHLPHGAIITAFSCSWYREDASATGTIRLRRIAADGTAVDMAAADSDASTGDHTVTDTSITSGTIDNQNYSYGIWLQLDTNNSAADVHFYRVTITYTIQQPLP